MDFPCSSRQLTASVVIIALVIVFLPAALINLDLAGFLVVFGDEATLRNQFTDEE